MSEILKEKIKKAFLSYDDPKGILGINPPGPLKMVDDAMRRCFRFYDGNGKEFISISVIELQSLPQEIKDYFYLRNPARENLAKEIMEKYVKICMEDPNEIVATEIVESLREWAF